MTSKMTLSGDLLDKMAEKEDEFFKAQQLAFRKGFIDGVEVHATSTNQEKENQSQQ